MGFSISKKRKAADKNIFDNADSAKILHKNMSFTAIEQYKLLRANLSFTLADDKKCHIIGVTSSVRGEGKSTTSINLSYVLAQAGKKVLLVDGDMRIPSVAKKMNIKRKPGVTNLIIGGGYDDMTPFRFGEYDNWYIVPAGDVPPNPSELLGSRKMERFLNAMTEKFEYIIIDLPPVNIVSDACAISRHLDGMLVVIREDYTSKKELDSCITQLNLSNVKILGCVMNVIKTENHNYKKYKKYKRYYKKYGYAYGYSTGEGTDEDQAATDGTSADQAATDSISADQAATDGTSAEQAATDSTSAEQAATDSTSADQVATDSTSAEQRAAE